MGRTARTLTLATLPRTLVSVCYNRKASDRDRYEIAVVEQQETLALGEDCATCPYNPCNLSKHLRMGIGPGQYRSADDLIRNHVLFLRMGGPTFRVWWSLH